MQTEADSNIEITSLYILFDKVVDAKDIDSVQV